MTENVGVEYGSAVVVTEDRYLLVNTHVLMYQSIEKTVLFDNIYIRFSDKEDYQQVYLIKVDENLDLALLRLINNKEKVRTCKIGYESKLNYGDVIYAIGNINNSGISITKAVVSLPYVNIQYGDSVKQVIQCDVIISEGSSGVL